MVKQGGDAHTKITMKIRFKFMRNIAQKDPFNGDYIEWNGRIPNINEHVCFDKCNKYEVVDVIHNLVGWSVMYTIMLK